jgi:predicted Zn-dependent protease with MMP-like domain/Flp pilus assembly protein TadD
MRFSGPTAFRSMAVGAIVLASAMGGCKRSATPSPAASTETVERAAMRGPTDRGNQVAAKPLQRCFAADASGAPARPLEAVLDRAAELYRHGDFAASLACAEEAARTEPRSIEAHHDRASALIELGRLAEAQAALQRALALDADDPETLASAADLYINRLEPSNDHTETGLELARRGSRRLRVVRRKDRELVAGLALLEGQALRDLGRAREGLARIDTALAAHATPAARYERAVTLFDLCRFVEARRALEEFLRAEPRDAWAHHYLGLVLERLGDQIGADRELRFAQREAPSEFHASIEIAPGQFRQLVDEEAARLPPELRTDLAKVRLETAELPEVDDLVAEEPPLTPTILGLFRGAPLGEEIDEREGRTIILYRRNLQRAVASHDELVTQVRTTLLHELGHLRGEDDDALRARGLE